MDTPVFDINNFCFSYPFNNTKIGMNGHITIHQGECVLLTGQSGSGKSSLLLALKGIIPHVIHGNIGGSILFRGRDINDLTERDLLTIGYLQQNPDHQLVCPDVFSELALGLENQEYTPAEIRHKINDYVERFQMSHLLDRRVSTLSGGEKQMVNLLAILLLDPEVLLLDEPTAFLDPESAHMMINTLKSCIHDKTVIIIEHNLHYIQNLVDRTIQISADGSISIDNTSIAPCEAQICTTGSSTQVTQLSQLSSEPLLSIRNLNFAYSKGASDTTLIHQLNLAVYPGQIVGIIGRNGSGKSTLLKLIAKLLTPSHGEISLQGCDISTMSKASYWQHISLVWQNPENHFLKYSVRDELVDAPELLHQINLSEQAQSNPFNLSEGQKRRLSLAIALCKSPRLCLLDEPTFGQDAGNKQMLFDLISGLALRGTSFIIVSHDMDFLHNITQDIYTLQHGELNG